MGAKWVSVDFKESGEGQGGGRNSCAVAKWLVTMAAMAGELYYIILCIIYIYII